jgi:hypothetical protein
MEISPSYRLRCLSTYVVLFLDNICKGENETALKAFLDKNGGIDFISKYCLVNCDTKSDEKLGGITLCLELLIKVLKKRIELTAEIINKGFIGLLSNFILETRVSNKENNRTRVIRTACKVFCELADLQDKSILTSIANITGIIPNLVLLLSEN